MINSLDTVRMILVTLFCIYQFWAFKNKKSMTIKLTPIILSATLEFLFIALSPIVGIASYFFIFIIFLVELTLRGAMLVVFLEACIVLIGTNKSLKKLLILSCAFFILAIVYHFGQKVF